MKEDKLKDLSNRLNRIEGQVRGVKGMLENEAYCIDIFNQVLAIQAALKGFSRELLTSHIKNCVVEDIKAGNDELVDELLEVVKKVMK